MSEALNNLRITYRILEQNVICTLCMQVGADTQLTLQVTEALQYLQAAKQHRSLFPPDEYATLRRSITSMIDLLDKARHLSSDPPPSAHLIVSTRVAGHGRPRVEIDPTFLAEALGLRGTTHLQDIFNCCARTIRRAAFRAGLAVPGGPVYTDTLLLDSSTVRTYSSTAPAMSALTDAQF
ncbi:hypothetical protein DFH09DRAFT_1336531 [Mycena vulgaris]|nr:hypothetical protein DFH09DRAFT_1336531 [Mycena vulgaris]